MDRSARSLMILAALLGPAGRSTPAAAETPVPSASATDAPRTTRRSPAPHDAEGLIGRPTGGGSIESLPSTVSPAIERLVRQGIPPAHTPVPAPMTARRSPSFDEPVAPRPARALGAGDSGGRLDSPRGRPTAPGTSPLALEVTIKPAPFEPEDRRFPINLAAALRLSDARPLIVAAAQASVWVAEAELTRAKVLWVPAVLVGVDYIRHDGGGPDFNKGIMTAPSVNFFYAGPTVYQFVNLTDAIFEPLAARQTLNARHWDVQAAKNDALLQTADAYFRVHQHRGRFAGALYTVERGRKLVDRITRLSEELVPKVEVDRAQSLLADLEQRATMARQEWKVASADLTQVLRLDPRAVIDPLEHDHAQISLIDPSLPLDELMPIALANRPELAARRAQLLAAEIGIRREKARPLLPVVALNGFQSAGMLIQGGIFGLGPNSGLNQWTGRADVSVQLMWQLEGFGVGNLARIKAQRGHESRAIVDLRRAQDLVAAEVTRAVARVQSAAARVLEADRALRTGIVTFDGHLEGLQQTRRLGDVLVLSFRPQEAVYSLDLLNVAFTEYFFTVAEYNRAQFELFHALGYPARELAQLRTPGEAVPVDTDRPSYLPPVGEGPPPADR